MSTNHISQNVLLRKIFQEDSPQKENFVKCDWSTQILRRKKIIEVENFQLLTMIFSKNFLFVEIFLEWSWALRDA